MALKEVEMPLNLTDVRIITNDVGLNKTKATFTGSDCIGFAKFYLKIAGDEDEMFYELGEDSKETDQLPVPSDNETVTYTLQRKIHGSQVGPTSDFTLEYKSKESAITSMEI